MQATLPAFRNHLFSIEKTELALHKNLMTCVIFGRENSVLVANETTSLEGDIICIRPGIQHRVVVKKGGADILYLDGARLHQSNVPFKVIGMEWSDIPSAFKGANRSRITEFRREITEKRPSPDPAVMEVVEHLYSTPFKRMSQNELSEKLGLERTMALRHFKETTGQTFRKFKIWAGIVAAASSAHQGEKIGLSGIDAGFADAAHTARTAKEVFGITPTKGLGGLLKMQTME